MKRKLSAWLGLTIFLCALGSACQASSSVASSSSEGREKAAVEYTDALDRHLSLSKPSRVAILIGSFADVWCAAGGKETLVAAADDAWTQFDLDLPGSTVKLGAVKSPSTEALLSSKPDLVIASANTTANVELLPILEAAKIPVVYFKVSRFEDYLDMLNVCAALTDKTDQYEINGEAVKASVEAAKTKAKQAVEKMGENPSVLYLRASGSNVKVKNSVNSVLGEMLADLQTRNIADNDSTLLENLSLESILKSDPDKIFVVMQGSDSEKIKETLEKTVLSNPIWQQLTAVQEGQVHYMDQSLYNLKPNARWGEAYGALTEILYGQ